MSPVTVSTDALLGAMSSLEMQQLWKEVEAARSVRNDSIDADDVTNGGKSFNNNRLSTSSPPDIRTPITIAPLGTQLNATNILGKSVLVQYSILRCH